MVTAKADNRQRIRIPDIKPGQVFVVDNEGNGTIRLTLAEPMTSEERMPTAQLVRDKDGFTVVVPEQPINEEAIKDLLADFP
jgi:hypothetical protein